MLVTANDHDTVDELCWRHLGTTRGTVEATYARNPGLARRGPMLPAGLQVELAAPAASPTRELINLWD